jgi:hypothetical protein
MTEQFKFSDLRELFRQSERGEISDQLAGIAAPVGARTGRG